MCSLTLSAFPPDPDSKNTGRDSMPKKVEVLKIDN